MTLEHEQPEEHGGIRMRAEMEARMQATVVTFRNDLGAERPGGMCSCCGCGPDEAPDYQGEPWYVYQAGVCDADGAFFSMLCQGCLVDIREENAARPQTMRDEQAKMITELLGDDVDGAQSMMDDWEDFERE